MTRNPFRILNKPIPVTSWILFVVMIVYIGLSLLLFFQWVNPSLDGRSDRHIAADSTTYIYFAESLRQGRPDPIVLAALAPFPNTLWCPVLIALALKSTFTMVLANYAIFFCAVYLLRRSFRISSWYFMGLMSLNATTMISLLSVNKEIVDFLIIAIFLFGYKRGRRGLLAAALILALLNRFEVCLVMLLFLLIQSKLNPWRNRRVLTLVILVVTLDVALPLLASKSLNARFEEAREGHMVALLDLLEMHYLYFLAVIPKIAENLLAEIINVSKFGAYLEFSDIANTYIVFFNNLATAIVLFILVRKHRFSTRSETIYFAVLGWIIMAISLVIQPRYFYFTYVLLCLEASQRTSCPNLERASSLMGMPNCDRPTSVHQREETAFG